MTDREMKSYRLGLYKAALRLLNKSAGLAGTPINLQEERDLRKLKLQRAEVQGRLSALRFIAVVNAPAGRGF